MDISVNIPECQEKPEAGVEAGTTIFDNAWEPCGL